MISTPSSSAAMTGKFWPGWSPNRSIMTESDLASQVIAYLQDLGWKCYQEVQWPGSYGDRYPRADIAAVQGKLLWLVETKMGLGLPVIAQADYWSAHCHFCSIAVPSRHKARRRGVDRNGHLAERILKNLGVGWLSVESEKSASDVREVVPPRLNRRPARAEEIRDSLHEGLNEYRAGNPDGQRWTAWGETCRNLQRFVDQNPGVPLHEAIDSIDHHYRKNTTARSCMRKWLKEGKVRGVELRTEGKVLRVYPEAGAKSR